MLSPELVQLAAMALAGLAIGGGVYVLVLPYFSGERKAEKRVANVAQGQTRAQAARHDPAAANAPSAGAGQHQEYRGQAEGDQAGAAAHQADSRRTLDHAAHYYLLSLLTGVLGGVIVLITGSSPIVSLLVAFACGFGLPRWIVSRMTKRRQAKFLTEFANAIDIIVRGIKSGLPLPIACRSSPRRCPSR